MYNIIALIKLAYHKLVCQKTFNEISFMCILASKFVPFTQRLLTNLRLEGVTKDGKPCKHIKSALFLY